MAVKSLKLSGDEEDIQHEMEEFEREVSLLSSVRHPNVVSFFGICQQSSTRQYMVVEYLEGGSLDSALHSKKLDFETKLNILTGVARGMSYLHGLKPKSIVHRDLKPGNILLDKYNNCKVCDFGLSKVIGANSSQNTMTTNIGTLFYCPPETIAQNEPLENEHIEEKDALTNITKIDVYSFAIIMWETFFEENPYVNFSSSKIHYFSKDDSNKSAHCITILSQVVKGTRPKIPFSNREEMREWLQEFILTKEAFIVDYLVQVVEKYMDLMKRCWSSQPCDRPTFDSIIIELFETKTLLERAKVKVRN